MHLNQFTTIVYMKKIINENNSIGFTDGALYLFSKLGKGKIFRFFGVFFYKKVEFGSLSTIYA